MSTPVQSKAIMASVYAIHFTAGCSCHFFSHALFIFTRSNKKSGWIQLFLTKIKKPQRMISPRYSNLFALYLHIAIIQMVILNLPSFFQFAFLIFVVVIVLIIVHSIYEYAVNPLNINKLCKRDLFRVNIHRFTQSHVNIVTTLYCAMSCNRLIFSAFIQK